MKRLWILPLLLMTSCAGANFSPAVCSPVTTSLFHYSQEFQTKAADEETAVDKFLGYPKGTDPRNQQAPECDRMHVWDDCSALRTMIRDYGYNREQDRRLGAVEQP